MSQDKTASLLVVMKRFFVHSSLVILHSAFVLGCSPGSTTGEGDVRAFLTRYFSTWSARDMDGYGACFHEQARIVFVQQGAPRSQGLTDFLHGQKISHASATQSMTEVPTHMKILRDERTAQASVRWKLTKGAEVTTGTDCFTLIKTPSGWKIMSLVFYND